MSIFDSVWGKLTGQSDAPAAAPTVASAAAEQPPPSTAPAPNPAPVPADPVDVMAVLQHLAEQKGTGGNWRTSIVDLLHLLDLDHSLPARHQLAEELNVHAGPDGSAEQNKALYAALMQKIADNGGQVPDALKA